MLIEEAVKKAIRSKKKKRVIVEYDARSNRIHKVSVIEGKKRNKEEQRND